MSDIPLRKYLEELEGLIDKQQIDEAIAHCRHILSVYPKHIDTYRVLGKALLEKGRHGDAADIFQRVLSSVPDDFVAHVGMSIVREDEANLEAALWHMERAFEATPSNGPIQDELRRLYGRRDGVVPPKARLTRGALARMYVKGDLYPQAEAELKAALAADPERVDLTTVLAQVYWRSDQRAEAAETCNTVLQKLPYSQEANRIIAALLTTQGRTNDAVTYRQRLEALDPYEAFVQPGSNGHGAAHVNPDAVRVPTLEYLPGAGESASGSPDWMQSIGEQFETPAATPAESMPDWMSESPLAEAPAAAAMSVAADMPDWMKDMQPGAEAAAPGLSFAPGESAESAAPDWLSDLASTPAAPAEDMPDWLKKATGPLSPDSLPAEEEEAAPPVEDPRSRATGTPAAPPSAPGEIPDWMKPATGPLAETELPDWMKAEAPPVPSPAVAPTIPPAPIEAVPDWMKPALSPRDAARSEAEEAPAEPAASDEIPDWLKPALSQGDASRSGAEGAAAPLPEVATPTPEDEIPDWLKAATAKSSAFVETPEVSETDLTAMSDDEAMRWLEGLAAQQGAKPEELITQPPPEAAPPPFEAEAVPSAPEEIPAWMKDFAPAAESAAETEVLGTAQLSPEALPDWMKPILSHGDAARSEAEGPGETEAAAPPPAEEAPAIELPAWMKPAPFQEDASRSEAEEAAVPTAAEEPALSGAEGKPDWLKQMEAEADQYEDTVTGKPPAEALPIELPAWMKPALSQEDASRSEAEEAAVPTAAEPKATAKLPVELPDFLQPASPEAIARANEPTHLADDFGEEDKENWLKEVVTGRLGQAEEAEVQPAELPDWIKAMAPVEPATPTAEAPAPPAQPAAETPPPPEQPAAAQPDLASMDSDQALRWLEGLALQQGAKPEEMVAPPEAGQPESPEWLRQPSAESQSETPPAEVPSWVEPLESAPTGVTTWLSGKKVPEWLRQPGEQAPMPPTEWLRAPVDEEPAQPAEEIPDWLKQPEAAPAEPAAPAAEPGAMSEDEARLWLEGLAAQQGAKPDELITPRDEFATQLFTSAAAQPPERTTEPAPAPKTDLPEFLRKRETVAPRPEPKAVEDARSEAQGTPADEIPDWLKQMEAAASVEPSPTPAVEEARSAATGTPAGEIPDWLKQMEASMPAEPAPAAGETPAGAQPDLSAMSAEEALRWLEGLAAQQGARPEELLTQSEERLTQPPAWIGEPTAEPEAAATPADEIPDWLKQIAAPVEPPPAPTVEDTRSAATGTPEPDLSTTSAEEALRWLEGLAAQQGARPEELLTQPEERLTQPPSWIAAQAAQPVAEEPQPKPMDTAGLLPSLASILEETAEAPAPAAPPAATPEPSVETAPAPSADLGSMSAEDALRWLEGLAAQQGAKPEELLTRPEERLTHPPTWVPAQPAAEVKPQPAPTGTPGLPPSLAAALEETQAPVAPPTAATFEPEAPAPPAPPEVEGAPPEAATPERPETSRLARLAERLAESKRAKEMDIAARFETQRAQQEAARLEVQRKMEEKRVAGKKSTGRLGTGPLGEKKGTGPLGTGPLEPKPATGALTAPPETGMLVSPQPPTASPPEPAAAAREPEPASAALPQPVAPAEPVVSRPAPKPRPKSPVRPRGRGAKSPYAAEPPEDVLALARQHLAADNHADAAEALGFLVTRGQMVDEVIVELEGHTARRRPTPPLLRVLGDAYMKNNRLQKALDTYRTALGQL